jgi:hypothetical protein
MRNSGVMIAAAGLWISLAAAQTPVGNGAPISSGVATSGPVAPFGRSAIAPTDDGKPVTGKPLSATEERRTVRILADGTRLENTDTDKFYRDDEGRTRIQRKDGSGMIHDPAQAVPDQITPNGDVLHNLPARYDGPPPAPAATPDVFEEDLGDSLVNGVIARGSRTTTTVPPGQIGNDRPIRLVSERWYSTDLQIAVKTIDSDPRYGETTWQLIDIHPGPQDSALFRHPTPGHPPVR